MTKTQRGARALAELGFSSEEFDRLMVAVLVELRNLEVEDGQTNDPHERGDA